MQKIKVFGPVEQRSARQPVTLEVASSNLVRVAIDTYKEVRYNINMWNPNCDKCMEGEHGMINERGSCLCCGTIVDEELYVQERIW